MASETALDIKERCKTISSDLKSRRITQKQAADLIGTTKQTIANQLSGKKRFSVNMAQKFNEKLGYSIEFLLYGQGPLYASGRLIWHPIPGSFPELLGRADDPILKESAICKTAMHLLEIINDKLAIECFEKCLRGDIEESNRLMDILVDRYGYDIPMLSSDSKRTNEFREMRQWFRKVEVLSAKKLILIEQKAAKGEIVDVDAEVERFRERLISIKNSYKGEAQNEHPEISLDNYLTNDEKKALDKYFKDVELS